MNSTHNRVHLGCKLTTVLALGLLFAAPALAEEEAKPTANLTVAALSQYIFRGFEQGKHSMVVEPSLTTTYQGFSANLWGNLDTDYVADDAKHWEETDLTLSYTKSFDKLGLTGGYIYYGYGLDVDAPAAFHASHDTQEFFASATYDCLFKPTLTVYRDIMHLPGWYVTLGGSYSVPVTDKLNLDLGAKVSYLKADDASSFANSDGSAYSAFHDGVLSAAMNFPINTYITVTPQLSYSVPLSGKASDLIKSASFDGKSSDFVYGGVAISLAF